MPVLFVVQDDIMESPSTRQVARIDQQELSSVPHYWTDRERGRHLRQLLQLQGIDPERFFGIEYHPRQRCWVVVQDTAQAQAWGSSRDKDDESFYQQARMELRHAARTAFAYLATHSSHFALTGGDYQLPPTPEELEPAELVILLGGSTEERGDVRFDNEGNVRPGSTSG